MEKFKVGDRVKVKGGSLKGEVWSVVGKELYDVKIQHLPEVNTYNSNELKLRKPKKAEQSVEFKRGDRVRIKLPGNIYYGKKAVIHEVGNFSCSVVVIARKAKGVILIIHVEHLKLVPKKINKPTVCEVDMEVWGQMFENMAIRTKFPIGGISNDCESRLERGMQEYEELMAAKNKLEDTFMEVVQHLAEYVVKDPNFEGDKYEDVVNKWKDNAGL